MSGSGKYVITKTEFFIKKVKKLEKSYGKNRYTLDKIFQAVSDLFIRLESMPKLGQLEPLPRKLSLKEELELRKLRFDVGGGESGTVRIIYLLNNCAFIIKPLFIYNHKQYKGRPPDWEITSAVKDNL